jgi:hypothetical protein
VALLVCACGARRTTDDIDVTIDRGALVVDGVVVHPGAFAELTTWLSDGMPRIAAVDLIGIADSNRWFQAVERSDDDVTIRNSEGWRGEGSFTYRAIGRAPNGIVVVETWDNGGGSGVFESLLLVRIERHRFDDEGERAERIEMRAVGEFSLGDRAGRPVELDGALIRIGAPTDPRWHRDDGLFTTKVIDTSGLL